MKKHAILFGWKIPVILLGLLFTVSGCNQNSEMIGSGAPGSILGEEEIIPPEREEILPVEREVLPQPGTEEPEPGLEVEEPKPKLDADDYAIVLDAEERIILNRKGHLLVWIGLEKNMPEKDEGEGRDSVVVPSAEMKTFARISIFAPEFTVEPAEPQVTRVVPSGSSVPFAVTPKTEGSSKISATVELFDNEELRGMPESKTETVSVTVYVDQKKVTKDRIKQLTDMTWDKFLVFWGALLVIVFGLVLYLIRKFLKNKTGFDQKENGGDIK
jgi:hypothetical protein